MHTSVRRLLFRRVLCSAILASVTGLLVSVTTVFAENFGAVRAPVVQSVRDIAGSSPFTGSGCNVATPYYTSPGGKGGEPYIAVNPRHPSNRVAVWMDATRATDDTAFTTDGGRSWTRSIPQGIDECTGNFTQEWEASGDPWISFGPDGLAYLSTLAWAHFVMPPYDQYVSVVHVQTSRNGGRTWSTPVLVSGADSVSDKPMIEADPYRPGVAYEIWRNQSFGMPVGARGATLLLFAVTTNHGLTWSAPQTIASGGLSDFFGNPQLSVLRDGTLIASSSLANGSGGANELAWRSTDGGKDWQGPVVIRNASAGSLAPICGQTTAGADSGGSSGQQAVLNGRSVLFVTDGGTAEAAGMGELILSRSDDGGLTWRSSTILRSADPVMLASIAADDRGNLGLVWDEIDTRHANCSASTIPVRSVFAVSTNGGASLSPAATLGTAEWNLYSALRGSGGFSGYFVGDYQALSSTPDGFTTVTVQGEPLAPDAPPISGDNGVMVANVVTGRAS